MIIAFLFFGIITFGIGYLIFMNVRNRRMNGGPELGLHQPLTDARARVVAAIAQKDPNFSIDAFLERSKEIFIRVQEAWSSGNMAPVRNFLSQGVYNRFQIQLEIMRSIENLKNVIGEIRVISSKPQDVNVNGPYITIHVAITASARDVTLDAGADSDQLERSLKSAPVSTFTEVYSFTRKLDAQSDSSRDLLNGQCPRCGFVPDNFSQVNRCPSCGALYNSGEYDWVLSEITQMEEWRSFSALDVPGMERGMSRQVIEDRASYLFWRWIQSRVRGSSLPLMRDATVKMKSRFVDGVKEYLGEVAVGAVDLEGIESNDAEYRAFVFVQWSASTERMREPVHFDHRLHLVFSKKDNLPEGFADHGCVQCGAPLPDTDALSCAYCGATLPEVNNDWLLDEVNEQRRG